MTTEKYSVNCIYQLRKLKTAKMKTNKEKLQYSYNDGGRSKYFKGSANDCGIRALAIFTGENYKELYNSMTDFRKNLKPFQRKTAKHLALIKHVNANSSPRNGLSTKIMELYIKQRGFNCLHHKESRTLNCFGTGTYLILIRKHFLTIKNGILQDTWDSRKRDAGSRDGNTWEQDYYTATQFWEMNPSSI